MSHARTTPSLSGVLVVLNIVLALVWVPFLDSVDNSTNILHAVLIINATTTAWWIWVSTHSMRGAVSIEFDLPSR